MKSILNTFFVLILSCTAIAQTAPPVDYPDTTGIAAELAAFQGLEPDIRKANALAADEIIEEWLDKFSIRDGEVKRGLLTAIGSACYHRARNRTYQMGTHNILGEACAALEKAVQLNPLQTRGRVTLGMVMVETGRHYEGVCHLEKAVYILRSTPVEPDSDEAVLAEYLAEQSYFFIAMGYRDYGLWDKSMEAVEAARDLSPSPQLTVIKGLCIAGLGKTSEAISYAVNMQAVKFRHRSALSSGMYARASDYANRWIKSQALFADGDLEGARHVLGELADNRTRRMPLESRFWQDAGLIHELLKDPAARRFYDRCGLSSFLSWAYPSIDRLLPPLILGFPSEEIPFFVTPDQRFEGGSPFAFIVAQLITMTESEDPAEVDAAHYRALEMCRVLLRRHVQADLVRAFRAQIHLAAGHNDLALPDLEFAHAGFASRGLVDPGTSILLGEMVLLKGDHERSRELFDEALALVPDNAQAWRDLGVAMGRAQQFDLGQKAMEKALELEPDSMEGWFNLGVLMYRQGDFESSLDCLEKAWNLEPGNPRIQAMLQTVSTAKRLAASGISEGPRPAEDQEPDRP